MGFASRFMQAAHAFTAPAPAPVAVAARDGGGEVQRNDRDGWMTRWGGGSKTSAGTVVTETSALTLPAVYAAISAISKPIASLPFRLYQTVDGRKRIASEHPMARAMQVRANDRMTSNTLRKTVQAHALTWGNGYCEIERKRNGQAVALWPLLPDRTAPRLVDDVVRYHTNISGREVILPSEDVLHIHGLGFDGLVGYSPIRLARETIGIGKATESFGAKFFGNDAKSGGVIMHPGKLSGQAKNNIRQDFEGQGGPDNAHRIKVMEEGMKWVSTTIPPDDSQFLATREFTVADVARMYDVPLFLLQSMEKSTTWGSGIEQMLIGFVQLTLTDWAVTWEQEMDFKTLTEAERAAGYFWKIDLRGLMRGDMAARAAYYGDGIADGWLLRSEARDLEDLDPVEGLDEPLVPLNMQTVAQQKAATAREEADAKANRGSRSKALKQQREGAPPPATPEEEE